MFYRVKQLQTQLVEKEAMVKVFQRSPLSLGRSSSLHALCHTSLHSPRPSLISSHTWQSNKPFDNSSTQKEASVIRHVKTGSTSAIELGRKMSIEEDLLAKVQSLSAEVSINLFSSSRDATFQAFAWISGIFYICWQIYRQFFGCSGIVFLILFLHPGA